MIKVSDYIAKRLKEVYKVEHFFMVSGGGAMHLNDSLGRYIPNYIANHHEQACAIAAEGYSRVNQKLAVVNVTTGPGGLNCLNGVFGQWTDSVPVLYLSGQVKFTTTIASCPEIPIRQLGDQEVDIISVVKPLTKYAKMVTEPKEIKYHLDKAIYEATTGRFGPVWLDIPMNVQGAMVDENELVEFTNPCHPEASAEGFKEILRSAQNDVFEKIISAKRPLIIAGHGIRLSKQEETFYKLIEKLQIPVVTTFNGFDLMEDSHPLYIGRIGTIGQRAGNFALQNADLILCLGTRNNVRQASYNYENFAKNAYKIIVDIDKAELDKQTVIPDLKINADLSEFLPELLNHIICHPELTYGIAEAETKLTATAFASEVSSGSIQAADSDKMLKQVQHDISSVNWLKWCQERKQKFSFENFSEYEQKETIDAYIFSNELTNAMKENDILVMANGSACVCTFQTGVVKKGQRFILNSGDASMGYDLPAAIGASLEANSRNVICLAGDGSIMMNLQELQTIKHNNLPIKIFVLANEGYASIKQTQKNFFDGRMVGSGEDSGVSVPDFIKIGQAFGIKSVRISKPSELNNKVYEVLATNEPVICEVVVKSEYSFSPKLSARKLEDGTMVSPSLEDMFPFLERDKFEENIIKIE